jgi:hypothetical protein
MALAALAGLLPALPTGTAAARERLQLAGAVSLESTNYPGYFMRHRNTLGELTTMGVDLDRADATFYIRPGLTGAAGSVSFESFNYPGTFLRHQDFRIKQHRNDGAELFLKDATFYPRDAPCPQGTCRRYEASNVPGNFIRHSNYELWIAADDGSQLFALDSAWREVAPQAGIPGTYTMVLPVASSRPAYAERTFDDWAGRCYPYIPGSFSAGIVGWGQDEYGEWPNEIACMAAVWQLAVQFNWAPFDQVPSKVIEHAAVAYDEVQSPGCLGLAHGGIQLEAFPCWRSGGGSPEDKPNGCVDVRVPAWDWPNVPPPPGLIPSVPGPAPAVVRVGPHEWDVTEPIRWQRESGAMPLQPPGSQAIPGFGLLLTGWPTSLDQLTGDDDTICVSYLSNIRLVVTFRSFNDEPFVGPR